jgi:small subunit ribosomal protein S16
MLSIRLQRVGRKHEPAFRLVLTDSKNSTKSGRFLEILGSYDSRKGDEAVIDSEKVIYWISKGAQTSDTVNNLLISKGIIKGEKRNVLSRGPKPKVVEPAPAPAPASTEASTDAAPVEVVDSPVAEEPIPEPAAEAEAPKE